MTHRGTDNAYGDLAERRAKMDSKYDGEVEKIQISFIEANTGEKYSGNFQEWLKSGVIICKLLNALQPGAIKTVHSQSMAFKQMENISNFLSALPAYGVRVEDAFQTADLFEGTNMAAVQVCLENVRRIADLKKKGVSVQAQTPTRAKVAMPAGTKKMGEAPTPAPSAKYTAEKKDDAAYGDLAERMDKLKAKYDPALESSLRLWIEQKTGSKLDADFHAALRDGVVLCKLANALKPGSVAKVNESKMAFKQMENINAFLEACKGFGVRDNDLFQTVALYEAQNMVQVLTTLDNVRRLTS